METQQGLTDIYLPAFIEALAFLSFRGHSQFFISDA